MAPVEFRDLSKRFGGVAAVERPLVRHRGRPRDRLPRAERRRQEHDAPRAARPGPPVVGLRHVRRRCVRGARAARRPRRRGARGRLVPSRAQRPQPPAGPRRSSPAIPPSRVDEVLAAVGLDRCSRPAGQGLLDGHAPAPGHRRRAARRPGGADPRRADQRAGPAGHQLAARPAARAGGRGGAPCSSPATCWPRSRCRSTTSSSSPAAQLRAQGTLEQVLGGEDGPATEVRAQDPERLIAALERAATACSAPATCCSSSARHPSRSARSPARRAWPCSASPPRNGPSKRHFSH